MPVLSVGDPFYFEAFWGFEVSGIVLRAEALWGVSLSFCSGPVLGILYPDSDYPRDGEQDPTGYRYDSEERSRLH